ncbi:sensor domain-containing diguanylate cyclase [Jiella avicenniae]|uniref:diguanylate cyclase n=1 Tax=Jiella avicenniae TaxID=2907202 RepID=A0A9X1NZ26_9HYPH|nr:diguanylate cyclase [Jiella avicenniae]MCE7028142.1 diguanylate cyclase [Jiella avicenniae]
MPAGEFLLSVCNSFGIFALIALLYGYVLRFVERPPLRSVATGVLFGVGGCLALANTLQVAPGLFTDVRAVILVLAPFFGGVPGAVIAAAMTVTMRLLAGGDGAYAGAASIVAVTLIGLLFARFARPDDGPTSPRSLLALGLSANIPLLCFLVVPIDEAAAIFLNVVIPLTLANTLGVMILGPVMLQAWQTHDRNTRLVVEAGTDPLTGLANRREFDRRVAALLDEARTAARPLSVILFDIDNFKRVNDTLGHATGDTILVWVAEVVRLHLRADDLAARFGGEEIMLALPGTDDHAALMIAERIRSAVERHGALMELQYERITISAGVATARGGDTRFARIFDQADEALYEAKRRGRNRVQAFDVASTPRVSRLRRGTMAVGA